MNLVFDIDGVLANFTDSYAKRLVKVTGENLLPTPLTIPCWDWDIHYGYTKDQIAATWENILVDRLFWQKLDAIPEPEVFTRINALSKDHNVYFVTNRAGVRCKQQTEKWLYDRGINYPTVIIAADKLPILKAIKADFFCDDKLETMNAAATYGTGKSFYLIDAPYNQAPRSLNLLVATDIKDALEKAGLW